MSDKSPARDFCKLYPAEYLCTDLANTPARGFIGVFNAGSGWYDFYIGGAPSCLSVGGSTIKTAGSGSGAVYYNLSQNINDGAESTEGGTTGTAVTVDSKYAGLNVAAEKGAGGGCRGIASDLYYPNDDRDRSLGGEHND